MTSGDVWREAEKQRRAKLLREALEASDLNQAQLAERAHMDRSAVNQTLRGNRPFGKTVEARLVKALGLPEDYFVSKQPDPELDEEVLQQILARLDALAAEIEAQTEVLAELLRIARDDPPPVEASNG